MSNFTLLSFKHDKRKRNIPVKLTSEQIVNKKLKEANAMLKLDLSKLPTKWPKKKA